MKNLTKALLVLMALFLFACEETSTEPEGEAAPAISGAADGQGDQADKSCFIILRSVSRIPHGDGYLTTCTMDTSGRAKTCYYVWEGVIDVDSARLGDVKKVQVLYQTSENPSKWLAETAYKSQKAGPEGFQRYEFQIMDGTLSEDSDMDQEDLALVPFIKTKSGRIFDQNRSDSETGSYVLSGDNDFSFAAGDNDMCMGDDDMPTMYFSADMEEYLDNGPVYRGGQLKVVYDSERLRATEGCFGGHGSASSTSIWMGWKFDDGQAFDTQIESYVISYQCYPGGECPVITQYGDDAVINVAGNTGKVELWFYCKPGFSSGDQSNWKYDSNDGANYYVPVQ